MNPESFSSWELIHDFQIEVATLQARPEQVSSPTVTVESSTALALVWMAPAKPNGYVVEYRIYEASLGMIVNLTGSSRQYTITGKFLSR